MPTFVWIIIMWMTFIIGFVFGLYTRFHPKADDDYQINPKKSYNLFKGTSSDDAEDDKSVNSNSNLGEHSAYLGRITEGSDNTCFGINLQNSNNTYIGKGAKDD